MGWNRCLAKAPDWIAGHKALAGLKTEFGHPEPLGSIISALDRLPKHPKLWMAYIALLAGAGKHQKAADTAAKLRREIADLPPLQLLEARHLGFAGEISQAQALIDALPNNTPDLAYETARNALRRADFHAASLAIDRLLSDDRNDIAGWALAELCWRASSDPRHDWLMQDGQSVMRQSLGLGHSELAQICAATNRLHGSNAAPLGQSVRGGTQTRGDLRWSDDPHIARLFEAIEAVLRQYSAALPTIDETHPLAIFGQRAPEIVVGWSVRLLEGGQHISHLHGSGLLSSAAHMQVPKLGEGEGLLELGRPPQDIAIPLEPISRFAPEAGYLILFPSFLYHGTTPFADGERLTVAFDCT